MILQIILSECVAVAIMITIGAVFLSIRTAIYGPRQTDMHEHIRNSED